VFQKCLQKHDFAGYSENHLFPSLSVTRPPSYTLSYMPCLQNVCKIFHSLFFYAVYLADNMIYTDPVFPIPLPYKKRNFKESLKTQKSDKVSPEKMGLTSFAT
jgi:hypothetical protein